MTETGLWLDELRPLVETIAARALASADPLSNSDEAFAWTMTWLDRLANCPELLIAEAVRSLRVELLSVEARLPLARDDPRVVEIREAELEFYDSVMIRFGRRRTHRGVYVAAPVCWRYYRLDTSRSNRASVHQFLLGLARHWDIMTVSQIKVFFAGVCDVYVSMAAAFWNSPLLDSGLADAEGVLGSQARRYRISVRELSARPSPQRRWRGDWITYGSSHMLEAYLCDRMERGQTPQAEPSAQTG